MVQTAKHLVKLIKNGDDLIITHGNGPQVGQGDELLAVLCHLDVVPAGDLSNWETPPFEVTIKMTIWLAEGFKVIRGLPWQLYHFQMIIYLYHTLLDK